MKALLLQAQPMIETTLARAPLEAGHELVRCSDEPGGVPRRAVRNDDGCPLAKRVDVAVGAGERGTPDRAPVPFVALVPLAPTALDPRPPAPGDEGVVR